MGGLRDGPAGRPEGGGEVLGRRLRALGRAVRRLAGMPDYEGYVEHLRRCHPDRPVPTRRAFFDEYVRARYGDGPTRCC